MEAAALKVWALIQPYLSLLGGATLHVLFVKKISDTKPEGEVKRTWAGLGSLFAISILLGIFLEVIVVGYYSYNNLEATMEIRKAAWWLGAAIGFSGTVLLMKKLMSMSSKLFDVYVKWKFPKERVEQPYNDNYKDEYNNGPDDDYQDR